MDCLINSNGLPELTHLTFYPGIGFIYKCTYICHYTRGMSNTFFSFSLSIHWTRQSWVCRRLITYTKITAYCKSPALFAQFNFVNHQLHVLVGNQLWTLIIFWDTTAYCMLLAENFIRKQKILLKSLMFFIWSHFIIRKLEHLIQ